VIRVAAGANRPGLCDRSRIPRNATIICAVMERAFPVESSLSIRRAVPADAAGIAAVLEVIAAERIHSAIDRAWTVEEERRYLESRSPREALHVAVDGPRGIVGLQSLDLWSPLLDSMAHVGQIGTFLLPEWRGRGVGRQLWNATRSFAGDAGYRKLVIQVRGSNTAAQAFYRNLGFQDCGRLSRQVIIDGVEDDEALMEFFVT
jgi:ribosomal protein S18 acetylase RimI-like enzyme